MSSEKPISELQEFVNKVVEDMHFAIEDKLIENPFTISDALNEDIQAVKDNLIDLIASSQALFVKLSIFQVISAGPDVPDEDTGFKPFGTQDD